MNITKEMDRTEFYEHNKGNVSETHILYLFCELHLHRVYYIILCYIILYYIILHYTLNILYIAVYYMYSVHSVCVYNVIKEVKFKQIH